MSDFVSSHQKSKHPKSNKATCLHLKYKHYNHYKYNRSRKCNHTFSQYHNLNIDLD